MDEPIDIRDLGCDMVGQDVLLRGRVTRLGLAGEDGKVPFRIQDVRCKQGQMPRSQIGYGHEDVMGPVVEGQVVRMKASFLIKTRRGEKIPCYPCLYPSEVTVLGDLGVEYQTEDEGEHGEGAENILLFFSDMELDELREQDSETLIDRLCTRALQAGFKLVCEHAKRSEFVSMRCYLHSGVAGFNERCEFRICLQGHKMHKTGQYYTVTKKR